MNAQLELFTAPGRSIPRPPMPDPVAGFVPMRTTRNDPYRPFSGAEAKRIILDLCRKAGLGWVPSRQISRAAGMRPQDLARLESKLVADGEIEETHLYFGSSHPGDKGYQGFEYGYRLPQLAQEAA
ncbi:hypothetical protein D9M68_301010 [compost metagenome]